MNVLLLLGLLITPAHGARGTHGVVAADHLLASKVGVDVLKAGGDAVDAAVATALALGVVNPQSSGLGGGGFAVIWRADEKKAYTLDFRETAPSATHAKTFVAAAKGASRTGGLAVGVPGEAAGLFALHKRWGQRPWRGLVEPAARLANKGFRVGEALAKTLEKKGDALASLPGFKARFTHAAGHWLRRGETLIRPRLGKTLEQLATGGPDVLYKGAAASALAATVKKRGGVLEAKDLASYTPRWREPLAGTYRGRTVYTMGPPSSGGAVLLAVLGVLERRKEYPAPYGSSARALLITEAFKHAFADRARWFGDPDFVSVPVDKMLAPAALDATAKRIHLNKTKPADAYGIVSVPADSGTSHLSIIDAKGNAVALTSTINTAFGALMIDEESGLLLNNEMDDFTARPGEKNAFGLVQSVRNAVAPGKRPLSSMSPTVVVGAGGPELVVGGSGGPRIISATLQVMLRVLDDGAPLHRAVADPRFHHQWLPETLWLERGAVKNVDDLRRAGHRLEIGPMSYGVVQAAAVTREGRREGAADPRKYGAAAAY